MFVARLEDIRTNFKAKLSLPIETVGHVLIFEASNLIFNRIAKPFLGQSSML